MGYTGRKQKEKILSKNDLNKEELNERKRTVFLLLMHAIMWNHMQKKIQENSNFSAQFKIFVNAVKREIA